MTDQYRTVQDVMDDLHASYLGQLFPAGSYGGTWVVIGAVRCILPLAWLGAYGTPVAAMAPDWRSLSPVQAGLRPGRGFKVFRPAEHDYFGIVVEDRRVLQVLDDEQQAFWAACNRRRPALHPSEAAAPGEWCAVYTNPAPAMIGKVLDLRGSRGAKLVAPWVTAR